MCIVLASTTHTALLCLLYLLSDVLYLLHALPATCCGSSQYLVSQLTSHQTSLPTSDPMSHSNVLRREPAELMAEAAAAAQGAGFCRGEKCSIADIKTNARYEQRQRAPAKVDC